MRKVMKNTLLNISPDRDEFVSKLNQTIPEIMEKAMIPGLSIAVIRDGKLFSGNGFGVINADTGALVTSETVFEAASLSKPIFTFAVMKMVDRGDFDLDRPLVEYASDGYIEEVFLKEKISDVRIKQITARIVLSHKSGFPNWRGHDPLTVQFEPGEKFQYSGEGFGYLQKIIEKITGLSLEEFARKEVFEPLGMNHSSYTWPVDNKHVAAFPHDILMDVGEKRIPTTSHAASTLHTTAIDYAKFVMAVIHHTEVQGSTIAEMLSPQMIVDPEESKDIAWGLGVGLQQTKDGRSFWHWGDNRNMKCFFIAFPDQKAGVVYFTNSVYGLTVRKEIVQLVMGGDHPIMDSVLLRNYGELDSLWMGFIRALVTNGVDTALEHFRHLSNTYPASDIMPEFLLNRIGLDYLSKKKYFNAIKIFQLNAETYPDSDKTAYLKLYKITSQGKLTMDEQFLGSIPILPVKSVVETAKFFEEKLGFTIKIFWENPSYGVVERGNAVVEIGERRKEHAGSGVCIIQVENADIIYEEWKSKEIEFVGDFDDRDYGSKDFRIRDNNGNMLIISHALENNKELLQKDNIANKS